MRLVLAPLCHHLPVLALSKWKVWHMVHDASSVKGESVLAISARGEFEGGKIQDMPIKLALPED